MNSHHCFSNQGTMTIRRVNVNRLANRLGAGLLFFFTTLAWSELPSATPSPAMGEAAPPPTEEPEHAQPVPSGGPWDAIRKQLKEGKTEEAMAKLRKLRQEGDRSASLHYWMGAAYKKLTVWEMAWREFYQASLLEPESRTFEEALRDSERELVAHSMPTPFPTPEVLTSPLPEEELESLRALAESAVREGRFRLAAGVAQKYLEAFPKSEELALLGIDAALKAGAAACARQIWDQQSGATHPDWKGIGKRLEDLEKTAGSGQPETGSALDRASSLLDQLRLHEAMELLAKTNVQPGEKVRLLLMLARIHALRGEPSVARAYVEEAAFEDPAASGFLETPTLLEQSMLPPKTLGNRD